MIFILIFIIVILIAIIIGFNIQYYYNKKSFKIKLEALQNSIKEISKKEVDQRNQIQLSEEFEKHLKNTKANLNEDIFSLNYELFDILSKNNLLKK